MNRYWGAVFLSLSLLFSPCAQAENQAASESVAAESEDANSLWQKVMSQGTVGPKAIDLGSQGKLNLPEGMIFLPKDPANDFMDELGNSRDPERYGLVFPLAEDQNWLVDLTYDPSGYIKDDDAKNWDIAGMLAAMKEGTEEQNKVRKERGIPEIVLDDWIEKPNYDASNHRLIWSINLLDKHPTSDSTSTVNYNTYALGREGYINLTLITDRENIDAEKPIAQKLLSDISFNEGKRYADYNAATDKVAEYGLAALVGGVAAKKLGLFAIIGAFVAKFFKIIMVAAVGLFAVVGKWFKGKSKDGNVD